LIMVTINRYDSDFFSIPDGPNCYIWTEHGRKVERVDQSK
jgi:hypothetical protein